MSIKEYNIFIVLFFAGILFSAIHTIFVILTVGLLVAIMYLPFNWLSKQFFGKELEIPNRHDFKQNPKWSDWLIFIPFTVSWVLPLFAIGEAADCVMETDVWEHIYAICK